MTKVPYLPKPVSWIGWALFLIHTALIVAAISAQGLQLPRFGHALMFLSPWAIGFTIVAAGVCTFVAATRFGARYDEIWRELQKLLREGPSKRGGKSESMSMMVLFEEGRASEGTCVVHAWGDALPAPYFGLPTLTFDFEIPRYLELLAAERKSPRTALASLAGALAGSSVAGMLAFGRLAEFLQNVG